MSLAPIMISATSGFSASAWSTCAQPARDGTGDGEPDQPHRPLGELGQRRRDQHAGGLGGSLHAQADGAGVAEHREHHRLAAPRVGRRCRRRTAGRSWWCGPRCCGGRLGLLAEQGDECGAAQGDAATAVCGDGGQPSCRRCPRHGASAPRARSCLLWTRLSATSGHPAGLLTRRCDPVHISADRGSGRADASPGRSPCRDAARRAGFSYSSVTVRNPIRS